MYGITTFFLPHLWNLPFLISSLHPSFGPFPRRGVRPRPLLKSLSPTVAVVSVLWDYRSTSRWRSLWCSLIHTNKDKPLILSPVTSEVHCTPVSSYPLRLLSELCSAKTLPFTNSVDVRFVESTTVEGGTVLVGGSGPVGNEEDPEHASGESESHVCDHGCPPGGEDPSHSGDTCHP